MIRMLAGSLAFFVVATAVRAGEDRVFSGPQPGEKLTPFRVLAFSGRNAGKEITLIPKDSKGPAVVIFVHEVTRPGFQLMKPLDLYTSQLAKEGLSTHFVWLTEDKSKTEAFLNRAKKSLRLRSPIVVSLDGQEGPGNYGLNRKVTLTILVAKDRKTTANFAIIQPNETDAPKVLAAIAKVMNKDKAPTLASLQKELGTKQRPKAGKKNRKKDGKKAAETPPALAALMRQLIQKNNTEADIKKNIADIQKWAGDDRAKLGHVRRIGAVIIRQQYGTEAARNAMRKLIGNR